MNGALVAGALLGLGVAVVLAGMRPAAPDLAAAMARLAGTSSAQPLPSGASPISRSVARAATAIAATLNLDRHRADLALTGTTAQRMATEKIGYALVGLTFPVVLAAILALAGLAVPAVLPVAVSLGLAAAMSFLPEVDLARRADLARTQLRRTVCVYLELVALERAADAGAVESLERAAAIGDGAGFTHIREALLRARLEGRTPWVQLSHLADELRVPELGDVADIMRLSGEDGAAVLPTLRARAASLRVSLLQAEVTAANRASEQMSIPVALLGVAFMVLLGFPAFWRILFG